MKSLVRDKSPAELENINATQLKEMGVPQTRPKLFSRTRISILRKRRCLLVGELSSMTNVKNRRIFIRTASLANNESVATFLRVRAQLLAQYEAKTKSVARFVEANGVPFLLTRSGAVVASSRSITWPGRNPWCGKRQRFRRPLRSYRKPRAKSSGLREPWTLSQGKRLNPEDGK
jgi:hypothetical protein